MNKLIKHSHEEKDNIFYSSDWHVFHNPAWPIPLWMSRGYKSAEAAAEEKIAKINTRVGENSTLYYLGDMFLNATDEQAKEWLAKIKCKNIFALWGNHESVPNRIYKQAVEAAYGAGIEVYPFKVGNVTYLGNYQEIQVGKKHINLCHYPIHSWNKMAHNAWMLSGHQHNTDPTRNADNPTNYCLDISWDWKKDVWSHKEVEEIMAAKTFKAVDHHH